MLIEADTIKRRDKMITQEDIDAFYHANACCSTCDTELTDANWSQSWRDVDRKQCTSCSKKYNTFSNQHRMYVNGKYIPQTHPLYKAGKYKSFGDLAFGSLNNYNQIKEGYVYAITNPVWPEWVKIGKAIDAEDRLSSYQTSSPMRNYKLVYSVHFDDRNVAEKKAHLLAATRTMHPWNKHDNGEWFKLTDAEAIEILKEITID